MKIATLGPKGTYSELAAFSYSDRLSNIDTQVDVVLTTVNNSLRMVQNREVEYAVIPIENTIDGLIGPSFDALIEFHDFVKVCDEVILPISHVLARTDTYWDHVQVIYSHPSAINECQNQLEKFFPNAVLIPVSSTAEAAKKALFDNSVAAICNPNAAFENDLTVFTENIQDYLYNETRFMVCSLTDGVPTGNDRTLMAVRYGTNQPGQLYLTAKHFADAPIDLTIVHSRPFKIKPQEYVLVFEFKGHKSSPEADMALRNIEMQVRASDGWKKIIGSYPKRNKEDENVLYRRYNQGI